MINKFKNNLRSQDLGFKIYHPKSKILKSFVNNFNFPEPSWENLPTDFPYCDLNGLTVQEKHLYDAIKTMWIFQNKQKSFDRFLIIYKPVFISAGTKLTISAVLAGSTFVIIMTLVSITYYLNIRFNLGLTFLTDFFA